MKLVWWVPEEHHRSNSCLISFQLNAWCPFTFLGVGLFSGMAAEINVVKNSKIQQSLQDFLPRIGDFNPSFNCVNTGLNKYEVFSTLLWQDPSPLDPSHPNRSRVWFPSHTLTSYLQFLMLKKIHTTHLSSKLRCVTEHTPYSRWRTMLHTLAGSWRTSGPSTTNVWGEDVQGPKSSVNMSSMCSQTRISFLIILLHICENIYNVMLKAVIAVQ